MQLELNQAVDLYKQRQYESAREKLLQLNKQFPDQSEILIYLAYAHDSLGMEKQAIPFYEQAIQLGLPEQEKASAYLGLGSTYRCLGEYEKSKQVLERGCLEFPEDRALKTFLALTLYNLGQVDKAMEILIIQLAETTHDSKIASYQRALLFYAGKLDQIFLDSNEEGESGHKKDMSYE